MKSVHSHNNFYYFTAALVVLILASAMLSSFPHHSRYSALQGVMLLTELVAYFTLNLGTRWRRFIEVTIVLMLIANGLREFTDWSASPFTGLVAILIFYCGMAYTAARQALFSGDIELNTIVGTVAVYLLLGLIWTVLYLITMEFWPNGISGIEYREWNENFGEMVYFSFVTMTTLGYGDILPTVPIARALVFLQAITGTFYMAVVVASMVGRASRVAPE